MDDGEKPVGPPKLRIVKGKTGHSISVDVYESLVSTYVAMEKRSARGLARETGISLDTALRAVNIGWPNRGWAPLKERAKTHDDALAAAAAGRAQKTTAEVLDEQLHLATRIATFRMMQALRALSMNIAAELQKAAARATCDRQGKRTRVIDEVRGKKIVHRVVQEDVTLPPYLPDVASAIREMSSIVVAAAGAEQRLFVAKVPTDARKVGGLELTDEQIKYIEDNAGKLPPGVTREQLGW